MHACSFSEIARLQKLTVKVNASWAAKTNGTCSTYRTKVPLMLAEYGEVWKDADHADAEIRHCQIAEKKVRYRP